jgi:sugar/nucleoside kinase (ribokinase family)
MVDPGTKKPYDLLVAGELNVDIILNRLEKLPEIGKEILAQDMTLTLGSSSAILASNISTLGSAVTFAGKVGVDSFGHYILSFLESRKVNTSNIGRATGSTGATIVLNFNEDRAMVTYPGAMLEFDASDVTDESLATARHLHISSLFLQRRLKKNSLTLFQRARQAGLTTSLDPQWDPAEKWDLDLSALLPYVDIFLPNIHELKYLTGASDLASAVKSIQSFAKTVVVKCGSEGAYAFAEQEVFHQPAFLNKHVIDSIGAGDSFNAGFLHRFLEQRSIKDCLEFGALAGAINTTRAGGTQAFENLDIAKEIARTSFNYIF